MVRTTRHPRRSTRITRILVPTDFSASASAALRWGADLAASFSARLIILHAVDLSPLALVPPHELVSARSIDKIIRRLRADASARMARLARQHPGARTVVREGSPRKVILEAARNDRVDLIVMGTHGRTGVARALFGSVAEHVVRSSPVPVLTVRRNARR